MTWQHTFRVAHVSVGIVSEHPECSRIIHPLVCLYAETTAPADILFSIRCHDGILKLGVDDSPLWSGRNAGEIVAALEVHLYTHILARLSPACTSIHAAAVNIDGHACVFAGQSNAGKSSLCTAAVLDGAAYLSDEFALLREDGRIEPFPRPLQWGKSRHPAFSHQDMLAGQCFSKAYFRFPDHQGKIVRSLLWLPARIERRTLPLGWLFLPRYRKTSPPVDIAPIRRGEALMMLPEHLHHRGTPDAMLKTLNRRLPKTTKFFRLDFSDARVAWTAVRQLLAG